MCGINLVLNFSEGGEEAIQEMMAATRHRGPDQSAWLHVSSGIFLAANRLKIHELGEAGNQPVVNEDGEGILVWNGALYNCQELKNELLEGGVVFKSRSDAEVLIHWLRTFGEKGVGRLQGMFALIFVDKKKHKMIIARDLFGKKPLYYYHKDNQWLFSSEARGITASGLVGKALDATQYLPYFYSRHTFPDKSFFRYVNQLMPGKVLVLDFHGRLISEDSLEIKEERIDLPTVPEFREMVLDLVLKNFHADVPVGVILSGGVDSSLLLHTWYQETGLPLFTFTATFAPQYLEKYNDPKFAAALAAKYHCAHHEVLITPELVLLHWDEYVASLDQPIGDSASFLTWMVAKEAKKHVKILISGAGADELFSGYDRHKAFRFYLKHMRKMPSFVGNKFLVKYLPRRLKKFVEAVSASPEETYLNFSSLQTIPLHLRPEFLRYFPKGLPPYKTALSWDRDYYLTNDVLKIHDNATMAHGLEGRAPYMDEGLVALSKNLSEEQHLSLAPKYWMKEILKEDGWEVISNRKKMGFGLPLQEWLVSERLFRERVFSTIRRFEANAGRDCPEDMRHLARHPEAHIREGFLQVWNLFVLASWKEKQEL